MKEKKILPLLLALSLLLTLPGIAGCGPKEEAGREENTPSVVTEEREEATEPAAEEETPQEIPVEEAQLTYEERLQSFWGDRVFTRDEVLSHIEEGFVNTWEDWQLVVMMKNIYGLPENVLESIGNALGAYKWETFSVSYHCDWLETLCESRIGDNEDYVKLAAVLDLYGVTADTVFPAITEEELKQREEDNPRVSASQYATYEDGDAYLPYFSYYGSQVLAENDYIRVEGPRDITVYDYELIGRVARITNISDQPVYYYFPFMDKAEANSLKWYEYIKTLDGYEAEYDLAETLAKQQSVLGFLSKDVLYPGEFTYVRIDYGGYDNFNTQWLIHAYPMTVEQADALSDPETNRESVLTNVRIQNDYREIALFMKNRTASEEEEAAAQEYAVIKGIVVNEQGEPIPFFPIRVFGTDCTEWFTSMDGSFCIETPVYFYKTDESRSRNIIYVDGGRSIFDGKMTDVLIGEYYSLNGEPQEGKYSDYIADKRIYGQKSLFLQPEAGETTEVTIVVPDAYDHLVYDYYSEEDYGGQANYYDYGGDIFATVKFHDDSPDADETAYLNVFDHDGNLLMRKKLGIQSCCVCVSPDGTLVGTTIVPQNEADLIIRDGIMASGDIGNATIFDLDGNIVFEADYGTRAMEISHDNRYVALGNETEHRLEIIEIATGEVLWSDYRGEQIRHLIYSEDDSVLYMSSQECIMAYDAATGERLWKTFTACGFAIDMIMSSKYLYVSPKGTGGNDNKLMCIDRKTGETVWTFQTGSRGTKLTLSPDETLLFWGNDTGARDIGLYMLDANTGDPLWTVNYGGQAAWFTSDSQYVAIKDYGILEVFDRDGNKVATTACGSNARMSWFVYIKDDLSRILNIAGGGDTNNAGWLYNMVLEEGYDRSFIDNQRN